MSTTATQATTTVTAPTTTPTGSSIEAAVPAGFAAASVTFVSLRTGWVLGTAPCATPPCTRLLRTSDGGRTWVSVPAPPAPLSEGYTPGVRQVRFANLVDGWAFGPDLWATHDGGAHWARPTGLGADAQVMALETASGVVHAAVLGGSGGPGVTIHTSPVGTDAWRASSTMVPAGAGPVPHAQLVLHGDVGWLVGVNRTVAGGARLQRGRWSPWKPPCTEAGGPATLAASTSVDLLAVCDEGVWNDHPRAERAYLSADGGTTFHEVATPVPIGDVRGAASPTPKVFVLAGAASDSTAVLMATFDAGATWKTVDREHVGGGWADLGFTSPQQGVVVSTVGEAGRLLMTVDGGNTWRPVAFQ